MAVPLEPTLDASLELTRGITFIWRGSLVPRHLDNGLLLQHYLDLPFGQGALHLLLQQSVDLAQ